LRSIVGHIKTGRAAKYGRLVGSKG
jgi:hypothetical protein